MVDTPQQQKPKPKNILQTIAGLAQPYADDPQRILEEGIKLLSGAGRTIKEIALSSSEGLGHTPTGTLSRAQQQGQQQKLTDIQKAANEKLMKESYEMQQGMFDYTYNKNTAEAQVEQLKKAGLNPALALGLSGTGGGTTSGSGGTSVGGGQAADASATARNNIESTALGLQLAQTQSTINVQNAQKENIEADTNLKNVQAGNLDADTKTKNATRDLLVENMRQEGVSQWYENVRKAYMNENNMGETIGGVIANPVYKISTSINGEGGFAKGVTEAVLSTIS